MVTLTLNSSFFDYMGNHFSLYEAHYIDLNWETEERFNIGSIYQPPYHNVDNTGISRGGRGGVC